ncbi:MAG TPA: penicillin-binding transpeptidase domain-containing protein [Pyrinomonadaceae bacterium]|nr:penicillin-binding transpeptidase domain-containing protein [Pyrinomonadaceae bacterium]
MTLQGRTPIVALCALLLSALLVPTASGAAKKTAKPARPEKKSSRQEKQQATRGGRAKAEKSSAKDSRASKNDRAKNDRRASAKENKRETARERRQREREEKRAAKADRDDRRGGKMSRKERREAERRRREEIARREAERREAIRRAAIARAIALERQRQADQALRDEAAANIQRDNTTGEDLEVRKVAVEALGNRAGSVVVMNPKTGQVYTVVNQDWALRRGFKPCSTVKLVTGAAGLSDNVIDPVQTVNISTRSFRLDLTDALAVSNNGYFQNVAGGVGFDRMMSYAREFGLGQQTGINHPAESPGRLPVFKQGFALNRMGSHGDDIEVTTVQLANMASTIANGGDVLVPHLPRTPEETVRFKTEKRRKVAVPEEHLRRLVPGMIGAVNYGTGKAAYDPTQTVAGKTGTCIGQGSWLGLFTSYAPVHDPQLAVAVITRGSGERGRLAAGVAGRIYRGLNHRFGTRGRPAPVLAGDLLPQRPKIDARAAAEVSDEDKEKDEADAYVVSEAGEAVESAPRSGIKATMQPSATPAPARTAEPPARPSIRPSINTTPTPAPRSDVLTRPRRVNENNQ